MAVSVPITLTPDLLFSAIFNGTFQFGGFGNRQVVGTDGADSIFTLFGDDVVMAGDGDDVALGGFGNDELHGEGDNDILLGGFGNDLLVGGEGTNLLVGGFGADIFQMGDGSPVGQQQPCFDVIDDFQFGVDTIRLDFLGYFGQQQPCFFPDSDRAEVSTLAEIAGLIDVVDEKTLGTGVALDAVNQSVAIAFGEDDSGAVVPVLQLNLDAGLAGRQQPCFITGDGPVEGVAGADLMFGDAEATTAMGAGGDDALLGFAGNDSLTGDAGDDALFGGFDDDLLSGGLGDDTQIGGDGADELIDAEGINVMEGGAGADLFRGLFDTQDFTGGETTIVDLDFGESDSFVLTVDNGILREDAIETVESEADLVALAADLVAAGSVPGNDSGAEIVGTALALTIDVTPGTPGADAVFLFEGYGNPDLLVP